MFYIIGYPFGTVGVFFWEKSF